MQYGRESASAVTGGGTRSLLVSDLPTVTYPRWVGQTQDSHHECTSSLPTYLFRAHRQRLDMT